MELYHKIIKLLAELDLIQNRHNKIQKEHNDIQFEIEQIKSELKLLRTSLNENINTSKIDASLKEELEYKLTESFPEDIKHEPVVEKAEPIVQDFTQKDVIKKPIIKEVKSNKKRKNKWELKSGVEEFIGTNLINKIGILMAVIGIGIGTKYSIDNELISPLTRIILGYSFGAGLLAVAFKLKKKYEIYSAVLLSGSLAIMYFLTFMAYSFYGLFPQILAFALMLIFTVFTVVSALTYNNQIIAIIGLVGAYAVPFLLSDDSGNIKVFFSYITIINLGILTIGFKKNWNFLYYIAFAFTWLIAISWLNNSYTVDEHFTTAIVAFSVFYFLFYTVFLAYKLIKKENLLPQDVVILLLNSFIYFGLGSRVLNSDFVGSYYIGLFAVINAISHFVVAVIVYKQKQENKNLFYITIGLVIVFLTIAVPIQLDGNWVTLIWAGEAILMFWLGRTKQISVYEIVSYPLILLAFFSLIHDWANTKHWDYVNDIVLSIPFLNITFFTSIFVSSILALIIKINSIGKFDNYSKKINLNWYLKIIVPIIFIITLYTSFFIQITMLFEHQYLKSAVKTLTENGYTSSVWDYDIRNFKEIWLTVYTFVFLIIASFINIKFIKNKVVANVSFIINLVFSVILLISSLLVLSELRSNYLAQYNAEYFEVGVMNLIIRYVFYVFFMALVFTNYFYVKSGLLKKNLSKFIGLYIHTMVLWVLSSELLNWLDINAVANSYKLGLSILWGTYSLMIIVIGIIKKFAHYRIAGIILFALTLLKLFFYDISHLGTIAKTIAFVLLGVLLLIISFLYNKYRHHIIDDKKDETL